MPELVVDTEQRELAGLERRIRDAFALLREQLEKATQGGSEAIDRAYVERWVETARRLSVQVSNDLPPELDPEAVAEIRRIIINALGDLEEIDPERPLDAMDRFFLGWEAVRHIIRDALDEHIGPEGEDARALATYLRDALPRIPQADIAQIAGMSTRHLQRLAKEGGRAPRQLVLAARLVKLLRYVWTPDGAIAWFHRDRRELGGRAPLDLMENPAFEPALLSLARQGRAQHAA